MLNMEEKLRSANQIQDDKVPGKRKSEEERIGGDDGGGGAGGGSGRKPWRTEDGKLAGKLGKYEKPGGKAKVSKSNTRWSYERKSGQER